MKKENKEKFEKLLSEALLKFYADVTNYYKEETEDENRR